MASVGPTDVPEIHTSEEPSVDVFGPPHDHTISESLQLWIFVPGLISLILLICYIFYRIIQSRGERERKRAEKKQLKLEKKEKKKTK